jgi:hypothetical protein
MIYSLMRSSWLLPLLAAAGLSTLAAAPAQALDPQSVRPILRNVDGAFGSNFTPTDANSFGFFFDININQAFTNALGFLFEDGWNVTGNNSYEVTLWSYLVTDPITFETSYTELATKTFTPGDPNLLLLDSAVPQTGFGNYYWLALDSTVDLPNTGASVDPDEFMGYVLGVSGVFDGAGSVKVASGGTANFDPVVPTYLLNGFNAPGFPDAPVPAFEFDFEAAGVPGPGFWNANVSVDVPGPLPIAGAGSVLLWSRSLKRKIKTRG